MKRIALIFTLGTVVLTGSLMAQDEGIDSGPGDPGNPVAGRGVARLSVINGDVSIRRGDSGDVIAAALNTPLMVQDRVLTSSSSRAEVQFDAANMLRVGSNSEVRFTGLDSGSYQIQVAIGTVTFRTLRTLNGQIELDTPSVSIRPLKEGMYRVTVREDGSSEVTVRTGEAEIYTPGGSQRVEAGQTMLARGNSSDPEFQMIAAVPYDSWDRWNEERDRYITNARSREYVGNDIYGAEDLDPYGRWVNDPTYGSVWAPTVAAGWAPYREGRWVWEDFYGWTWVSYDPWGWAPYHYGRWFHGPVGWCWYPGPRYARAYWSPALVGFFGFGGRGGGVGVGFGFGNVGWVPLAPFEPFHRWWGGGFGRGGFNNTTIVNNVNITNVYRNARVVNGITGVNASDFGRHNGRFVGVNNEQIRGAGLVRGSLPVTPDRASLRFSDRQVNASNFPQTRNERFFTRNQAPAVQRTPFEQQQRSMAGRFGEPASGRATTGGPATSNTGGFGRSSNPAESHQWSRFGQPIHGAGSGMGVAGTQSRPESNFSGGRAQSPATEAESGGGWRRFGSPSAPSAPSSAPPASAPMSNGYQRQQQYQAPASAAGGRGWNYSAPAQRNNYEARPRQYAPSDGGYGSRSGNSAGPVRISPPIVRERAPESNYGSGRGSSQPNFSGPRGYSGGGGGGYRSAPSSNSGGGARESGGGRSGGNGGSGGGPGAHRGR